MKDPSESATLKIYRIAMKLKIHTICTTRSVYANFGQDPSNRCDPDFLDHGSSEILQIPIKALSRRHRWTDCLQILYNHCGGGLLALIRFW